VDVCRRQREEAAAATIETVMAVTAKTVMAAAVMEMTVANDRDGSGGNGNDRDGSAVMTMMAAAVAALNGKVSSSDREGGGGISRGRWLVSNISDVRIMWNITMPNLSEDIPFVALEPRTCKRMNLGARSVRLSVSP
jgi:hypothetical protein